ncbi:hypothetical protein CVT24_008943 [Panaeolus cyanescens]|uniref:F-box domain-containing protein n=1 Tax=Panaeolus cyanescens TaxID=181874 RepID=A0A409YAW7_9AGAR|nr:hypothetical protein CVT24_008943 [Panaeolus cyanescens]
MNVLELPADIWFYLLLSTPTKLKPVDIIALSQTCNALYRILSGKGFWWCLLKIVCAKNGIFLPSFNKDEMTARDIKRAVLAPGRMASILKRLQHQTEECIQASPVKRSMLVPVSAHVLPYTPNQNIVAMILLPGGRFLCAKTKDEVLIIDVKSKDPPLPQMRHKSKGDPRFANWTFLLAPSLDGSKFRITSIDQFSASGIDANIVILEFDPQAQRLVQIASRSVSQHRRMTQTTLHGDTLSGNMYAFFDPNSKIVYAWDFIRNVYVSWGVQQDLPSGAIFKKLMIDYPRKLVMLMTDLNVLIWELDPLLFVPGSGQMVNFRPQWSLPFSIRNSSSPFSITARMRSWSTYVSLNICYYTHCPIPGFDVLTYDDLARVGILYTYDFAFPDQEPHSAVAGMSGHANIDDSRPRVVLAQAHHIHDYPARDTGIKHSRLCDGNQVVVWEDYRAGLYVLCKPSSMDNDYQAAIHPPGIDLSPIPDSTTGETFPHVNKDQVGIEMVRYTSVNPNVEYPVWKSHETANTRAEPIFGASTLDPASGLMCSTSLDGRSIILHDYLGDFGMDSCQPASLADADKNPKREAANGRKRRALRETAHNMKNTLHAARDLLIGQSKT